MKKNILITATLLLVIGLAVFFLINKKGSVKTVKTENITDNNLAVNAKQKTNNRFLFVPYWTINGMIDSKDYDELIYFGITVNKEGIDKRDGGFVLMNRFLDNSESKIRKDLAVRLLDQETASEILKNRNLQEKVIKESIDSAQKNNFNGIVLDFEIQGIPFESFTNSISDFYSAFYKSCKDNNLSFYITVYGDTFYRSRPYDIKVLAQNSDGIFIMAYDLHKAGGDPGPNFPLNGKEQFGYDFKSMVDDFTKIVPKEKISIVFGLYGYDWKVDYKGRSKESAQALTLNQIKNKFLSGCGFDNCMIKRDYKSSETMINYIDNSNNKHTVWFEDMESVLAKQKYLKNERINSFGFWAYSYF